MVSEKLLEILRCPKCITELIYNQGENTLTCTSCGKVFAVKNDIPIMLLDDEDENA